MWGKNLPWKYLSDGHEPKEGESYLISAKATHSGVFTEKAIYGGDGEWYYDEGQEDNETLIEQEVYAFLEISAAPLK
ncbi:MAG TPA: hypothetical protein VJ248_05475 [Candidatus Udaeobacter sp.]|nr:hypothetical protein [Candidatus Udaeobacter sp.]